jgi:hypothetical protein
MFGSSEIYRQCPECGIAVAAVELDEHACEQERWLEFQLLQTGRQVAAFESAFAAYLASPGGRFEQWYAERERRRTSV